MSDSRVDQLRGAWTLVEHCAAVTPNERVLIVCDPTTAAVAERLVEVAQAITSHCELSQVANSVMHGIEPPTEVAEKMGAADVVFCVTSMSMAHTNARLAATDRGARFLSLPDYSLELLQSASLDVDFASLVSRAEALTQLLGNSSHVRIRSSGGNQVGELTLRIAGRRVNCCPGLATRPGELASPPDSEVNVPPWEDSAEGIYWVNGSIPCRPLGRLAAPLGVEIRQGCIAHLFGDDATAKVVQSLLDRYPAAARVAAEFGIGLNPHAQLTGRMLEDEGCLGTIHLGFGSNATIGGTNRVAFHLDCVTAGASVWADEKLVMDHGRLLVPA